MKIRSLALVLALFAPFATSADRAQAAAAKSKNAFQADFISQLDATEKKIVSLEEAVPQDKLTWRPAPGVRSISEVYLHLAYGNYGLLKLATGKESPADAGFDSNAPKWEAQTTDKAAIKKILEASFDNIRTVVKGLSDADLEKKVSFFGTEMTARQALMVLIEHQHEHLGQSIAYARMNKIVPPWSKG
jgi:uncharacterized damage-inducible protein DinB